MKNEELKNYIVRLGEIEENLESLEAEKELVSELVFNDMKSKDLSEIQLKEEMLKAKIEQQRTRTTYQYSQKVVELEEQLEKESYELRQKIALLKEEEKANGIAQKIKKEGVEKLVVQKTLFN